MPSITINDLNWKTAADTHRMRGYLPRQVAYGALPFAAPAETMDLIPRSEWADRARQKEKDRSRLSDLWRDAMGRVVFDQNGTNYCHANSAVMAVMFLRAAMNEPFVLLSPASVGGPVTKYTNDGAVIDWDLKCLVERGCCSQEFLGPNEISKAKNESAAATANAALHRVKEWWDFGYRDEVGTEAMTNRVVTSLLNNIPVPVGYNWWAHSVLLLDVIFDGNTVSFDALNSWGADYGDGGLFRLTGSKAIPDAAYAPRVTGASNA